MSRTRERVYKHAEAAQAEGGHAVRLDSKPVRTPKGAPLIVPSSALARAIAQEWDAQTERVRPETMPLTRLAATAIDRVAPSRAEVVDQVLRFAASDLVCHRAPEPEGLVRAQAEAWDPLIDWAARDLGVRLAITTTLASPEPSEETLAALHAAIGPLDAFRLAGLGEAVLATGSLVIGLALARGRLDAATAFAASQVDEDFQRSRWGAEEEQDRRRALLLDAIGASERFLRLLDD